MFQKVTAKIKQKARYQPVYEIFTFFFLMGFASWKAEQHLQGIEIHEKKAQKD